MRILLVCPDVAGIDSIAEVRQLQAWHDVSVLHGTVTVGDVYRALQEKTYDSVYFASHGGPRGIELSNGAVMTAEDIAQACRQKEVGGVFLSACNTGRVASYCVRHGLTWGISSEVELPDDTAWKLAAAFYGHQRNGHAKDFVGAYLLADSGDGEYALHISPMWVQEVQKAAAAAGVSPHGALPMSQQDLYKWGLLFLIASIVLSTILARLAGG